MVYKIAYLEDLKPDSVKRNIERSKKFEVTHIQPCETFEETLQLIKDVQADLLLMDFRLHAGIAQFNAPPFAQFFRSQVIENGKSVPIVLISSEDEIRNYYRDYTSFDLFDFAVGKDKFGSNTEKYCCLFAELIYTYNYFKEIRKEPVKIGIEILKIPEAQYMRIDSRLLDMLSMTKYQTDPFMMSDLLLSYIVKPIGILIGADVLSARLGVSTESPDWNDLVNELGEFKYVGLYGETYERWWSQGIDIWWELNFPSSSALRRISAEERCNLIREKYGYEQLIPLQKTEFANSSRFWTICTGSSKPLDPIDGFEIIKDVTNSPWLDPQYYSIDYLINHGKLEIFNRLKEKELIRFKAKRSNL